MGGDEGFIGRTASTLVVGLLLLGCGTQPADWSCGSAASTKPVDELSARATPTTVVTPSATPLARPAAPAPPPSRRRGPLPRPRPLASDGQPRAARLSIPALDIEDLRVRPHRGTPDDARGTRIQNRGIAASPYGTGGLVGPGGIGNYVITAHRLSSTQAFLDLPDLRNDDEVHVTAGGRRYTYRIVDTRRTSFRSQAVTRGPVGGGARKTRRRRPAGP